MIQILAILSTYMKHIVLITSLSTDNPSVMALSEIVRFTLNLLIDCLSVMFYDIRKHLLLPHSLSFLSTTTGALLPLLDTATMI